ncbi:50S ribosomal protein L10 [Candidatus Woesearchaeota archaeon]|nr:50S ribosomal protein L10 [Candidatus Woesearchaeota archaeon]
MNKPKAHVSEKKKREVSYLKELIQHNKSILIADLTNLPAAQIQSIKTKLKKDLKIRVTKKRLLKIAVEELRQEKNITSLIPYIDKTMPALLVTNNDPFSIYTAIKKSKFFVAAKPGQIAPSELAVEPGPTSFPPGPIIGELGQAGIIAAVEAGKVVVKKRSVLAKAGEPISTKAAGILTKLGVQPIEIGLNVVAALEEGIVYDKSVLDVDPETYVKMLLQAHYEAVFLAVDVSYITGDSVKLLLSKAYRELLSLSKNLEFEVDTKPEGIKSESQRVIGEKPKKDVQTAYSEEDAKKAQEVLNRLKEQDIRKKEGKI